MKTKKRDRMVKSYVGVCVVISGYNTPSSIASSYFIFCFFPFENSLLLLGTLCFTVKLLLKPPTFPTLPSFGFNLYNAKLAILLSYYLVALRRISDPSSRTNSSILAFCQIFDPGLFDLLLKKKREGTLRSSCFRDDALRSLAR